MKATFALLLFCSAICLATVHLPAETASEVLPDSPVYGVYPIAYRAIITKFLAERLVDFSSARIDWGKPEQASLTAPEDKRFFGYEVLVTVNSRNQFGMYTGRQKHRFFIRNGEIINVRRG